MSPRIFALMLPVLIGCSRSTTSSSDGASPVASSENDVAERQALAKLEEDWAKALEAHDTAYFARVVAPDFHGTGDSAKAFGRAEVIKDAADTATQVRDLHDEDQQIRIYGSGTVAVVTGMSRWTVQKGMRPGQYSGRYTETWVKREGRWQAVAGHYSVVPPPASQP